jgi:probable O-glycosylation ligase (exosortase A-associated)
VTASALAPEAARPLTSLDRTGDWWRPHHEPLIEPAAGPVAEPAGRVAFGALVAFIVILMLAPQEWLPFLKNVRIALVAALVSIGAHLLDRAIRRPAARRSRREIGLALALAGWAIVTVPLSYWPGGSVAILADLFLKAVAFFWLTATLVTTRERLNVFCWTLVLCSIPLAVTALLNFHTGEFVTRQEAVTQRIAGYVGGSGIAGNPNDLALMLNLIIPISAALIVSTRRPAARTVAAAALVLCIAAVIVTFSRAGFIALATIFVLWLLAAAGRRSLGGMAAALVLALCIWPVLPEGYLDRLSTITNISADTTGSAQGRWKDIGVSAELVAQNPITGAGIGQDILALNRMRGPTWRSVHNVYLQYAVDLGIPGLVLFLWLFGASLRSAGRVRILAAKDHALRLLSYQAAGVQIALVAFGVQAFFHPVAYQFYFFCLAGLAVALTNAYCAEIEPARAAEEAAS